jgi:RNA polymerase sigma-70 factor (ECF subfamily)
MNMSVERSQLTELLVQWSNGNAAALEAITPAVQKELMRLARGYMARERPGHTLQPTALVNEAYMRLIDAPNVHFEARAKFYAFCAQLMRRILVDHARSRGAKKNGGDLRLTSFDDAVVAARDKGVDILQLEEALQALRELNSRQADVVDMRFFGGLSVEETASVLNVSVQTVHRDWFLAKVWLLKFMKQPTPS